MPVLNMKNLEISCRDIKLVKNINLTIDGGEWLALVGESGSGKSITATSIGGLLPQQLAVTSGKLMLDDVDLTQLSEKEYQKIRGTEISYIFQDYNGAFTPFIRIGKQFEEVLKTHTTFSKKERLCVILEAFKKVSLPEARVYKSYPFQLSGGQLQRAAIAMATLLKPKLLIADEPTTALDPITANKILELISGFQKQTNCAVLFITHDLRHVRQFADQIAIMSKGEIVECSRKEEIFHRPKHPYTKQLISAIPSLKNPPARLMTS